MSEAAPPAKLKVNPGRIRDRLQAFARIGYRSGGRMSRLAFTQEDLRARQLLLHMMSQLGLRTRVDGFGNVFGRLSVDQSETEQPPVLVGSHLDTVIDGGRFDGSLGVVAALEVVSVLKESGVQLKRPIEVVSFACEESSRFGRGTLGSGLLAGAIVPEEVMSLTDADGNRLGQVLAHVGLEPSRVVDIRRREGDYAAFLEIHIEQGRVLEESDAEIGIVEAIAAPTRFRLTLTGQADHSGATPMDLRRDALAGAAEVILAVERCARDVAGTVGTVGTLKIEPGAINVVPGSAVLGIDVRATSSESKRDVVSRIKDAITQVARQRYLQASYEQLSDEDPVPLSCEIADLLEECCRRRSIATVRMPSGAGHDAMQMSRLCPTGMLLVPSRGGVSHHPMEWTDLDELVSGISALLEAVWRLGTRQD